MIYDFLKLNVVRVRFRHGKIKERNAAAASIRRNPLRKQDEMGLIGFRFLLFAAGLFPLRFGHRPHV
jgi:hypothetical protein